jgi:ketosteroid isomerase-like protein
MPELAAQLWRRHHRRVNAAQRYVDAARAHDLTAAVAEMAPDVVMRTPATDDPVVGREAVLGALRGVQQACDEFVHTQLLEPAAESADRVYALVFEARIGDARLEGVDLIELNGDDQIVAFTVIARPVASLMALGTRIAENRSSAG